MRSALTMLGVIIGVGAVITMLSVGEGAKQSIAAQISSMGSNLLMVTPGATTAGGVRMGAGSQSTLTVEDVETIKNECPAVANVAPVFNGVAQAIYGGQNWSTGVYGTTPDLLVVRDWLLAAGRPLSEQDVRSAAKVCLLGQTVVDNLFAGEDPIGRIIRIKNVPFTVVGVLSVKGQSPIGQDQDDVIHIPLTTAQKKIFGTTRPGQVRNMYVKAQSLELLGPAQAQITEALRRRHRIPARQENDFTVRNLTQMMQAAEQSTRTMTLLLGSIASVSLLVGGIGIMNIMLVSVTERTREIGVRMAIGARVRDIRFQFLVEAFVLSVIGGIVGIVIGVALSKVIASAAGWPVVISIESILIAFGSSGFTGVFFGFYPAYKASLMNPIQALRYE
jgi:putative ABC transport system permease protein